MDLEKLREPLSEELILSENEAYGVVFSFHQGVGAVYSARSPEKDTPNEDTAAILPFGDEGWVFAVADGVSGSVGGDEASSAAISALNAAVLKVIESGGELRFGIIEGFEEANRRVLELGIGAKTTLSVVECRKGVVRSYHAGDSPVWVVGQGGVVRYRSIDHSPVGYATHAGCYGDKESFFRRDRNVVSNIVGSPEMRIEIGPPIEISSRDTVLLATDGLSDNLRQEETVNLMRRGSPAVCLCKLAELCQERMLAQGGEYPPNPDDLAFILFRMN